MLIEFTFLLLEDFFDKTRLLDLLFFLLLLRLAAPVDVFLGWLCALGVSL